MISKRKIPLMGRIKPFLGACLFLAPVMMISCDDDDDDDDAVRPTQTIVALAQDSDNLSSLEAALVRFPDLVTALNAPGQNTVFAPSNQAQEGLNKFKRIRFGKNPVVPDTLASIQNYRKRFVIRNGNKMRLKSVDDAALFYADGKTVYLVTKNDNRRYIVDHTLQELERTLHPDYFFRINRKHILCIDSISEVTGLFNGKLVVKLLQHWEQDLCVSREKSQEFKKWLNR